MGLEIPIFFFPVDCTEINLIPAEAHVMEEMIVNRTESPEVSGLRQAASRNWWHLVVVRNLCSHADLKGLNFLDHTIAKLDSEALRQAGSSLDAILELCATRFKSVQTADPDILMLLESENDGAFEASSEIHDVTPRADLGFEAALGFYSFLKSLRAGINEALSAGQCLIYYRPEP